MKTEKLIIRRANPMDADALLQIYSPYVKNTAITFEYQVPTKEEFTRRISSTLTRYPYLAAEYQGELVGYAYAGSFHARAAYDWAVETSIYVDQSKKRMGIGNHLLASLELLLKKQGILNVNACIAYPPETDEHLTLDSVLFHEKQGYRMVGRFYQCGYKFRRWYDMVWMEKLIGEHLKDQPCVIPFSDLEDPYFLYDIPADPLSHK